MMGTMEAAEAAIKRKTDCVYFLASPLTCKKGSECEFRHSEMARLNPRDCWYWLNGNCLNPTCAFRHPPLDGFSETPSCSFNLRSSTKIKSGVPCYFYFNAYCTKGDQCPFMHDPVPPQKELNPDFDLSVTHPLEPKISTENDTGLNKASAGSDTGPASVEVPENTSKDTLDVSKGLNSEVASQHPVTGSPAEDIIPSPQSSPEFEEHVINPPASAHYGNDRSQVCPDQSSEEHERECEQDDWLESSPGFDVLVDNGSEQFAYDDDADHLLGHERESDGLGSHIFLYDIEDPADYDHVSYPEIGHAYDQSFYDSSDCAEDGHTPDYYQRASEITKERTLEPAFRRKRRPAQRDTRDGRDLRDHLRKSRRFDSSMVSRRSHREHTSRGEGRSRGRPLRPFHNGRLASEIGRTVMVLSPSESETGSRGRYKERTQTPMHFNDHDQSHWRERMSRRRNVHAPLALSSEVHRVSADNETRTGTPRSGAFDGPRTLAQIKEEKNQVKSVIHERKISVGFDGPRPLSEILNKKRSSTLPNVETDTMTGNRKQDLYQQINSHVNNRASSNHLKDDDGEAYKEAGEDIKFDSNFVDIEGDDDD